MSSFKYVDNAGFLQSWDPSVPVAVVARALSTARGNQYTLPDGAVTSVPPDQWVWACAPNVGSEASCVSEPGAVSPPPQVPPASGIMPAPIAPPPRVVAIEQEETARYEPWSSCHPVGKTLDEWAASLPCASAIASATSNTLASGGAAAAGWFGCLLVGLALCGAAADVFGRKN